MKHRPPFLNYSTLCLSAVFLVTTTLSTPVFADFNPDEGAGSPPPSAPNLPSTRPLFSTGTSAPVGIHAPPLAFTPLKNAQAPTDAVDIDHPPAYVAPGQAVVPAAVIATSPVYPPVDPATLQRAQQEIGTAPAPVPQASILPPPPGGFIAPAPLIAPGSPPPAFVAMPAVAPIPVATAIVAPSVAQPLSTDSKKILSHVPSRIDAPVQEKQSKIALSRVTQNAESLGKEGPVDAYAATGISISVHRPGLDTNFELNRAYTALSGGDSETAIQIYKNILSTEPLNQDALFGLASIYHRQGQLDKARPLYATLIKNYPGNREGLNNFLVLVSDESPQEALAELERLEQRNPDFSPIPAQEALVLNKLGYGAQAREKMVRAIELAPDNLTYKYNLAIMLDSAGDYVGASSLYRLLINASNKGETLPASADSLQKRLNYIVTAMTEAQAKG